MGKILSFEIPHKISYSKVCSYQFKGSVIYELVSIF